MTDQSETMCEASKWSDCRESAIGDFPVTESEASYPGETVALCESCAEHCRE